MSQVCRMASACSRLQAGRQPVSAAHGMGDRGEPTTSGRSFAAAAAADDARDRLLDAALHHVKQHGWTSAALVAAARDLGLSPAVTGIVPRREAELVEFFIAQSNKKLVEAMQQHADEFQSMSPEDRIRWALKRRLSMVHPHISSWPQALAVAALPTNIPHCGKLLGQMVDDVWHAAGDTSTDTSWYTKRIALAAVYTATELFMLTDYSPHFNETWAAMDRRLHDLVALGKAARDVRESMTGYVEAALKATQRQ